MLRMQGSIAVLFLGFSISLNGYAIKCLNENPQVIPAGVNSFAASFKITNDHSSEVLRLQKAVMDDSKCKAIFTTDAIEPGKSALITIDCEDLSEGPFTKTTLISTSQDPHFAVTVTGNAKATSSTQSFPLISGARWIFEKHFELKVEDKLCVSSEKSFKGYLEPGEEPQIKPALNYHVVKGSCKQAMVTDLSSWLAHGEKGKISVPYYCELGFESTRGSVSISEGDYFETSEGVLAESAVIKDLRANEIAQDKSKQNPTQQEDVIPNGNDQAFKTGRLFQTPPGLKVKVETKSKTPYFINRVECHLSNDKADLKNIAQMLQGVIRLNTEFSPGKTVLKKKSGKK